MPPKPDARMLLFATEDGGEQLSYLHLCETAAHWPKASGAPPNVAALLGTARSLYTLAWYRYELLVVAVGWSLLAVETALRASLAAPRSKTFRGLIREAANRNLIESGLAERVDAGRQIRNLLMHPRVGQPIPAWTPAMSREMLSTAHAVVAQLYGVSQRD